ncbi:MAG: hypothetical protein ACKO5A_03825 [Actinomycetota bacterium]
MNRSDTTSFGASAAATSGNRRRRRAAAAVLIAGAVLAAGCSGGNEPAVAPEPTAPPPPAATPISTADQSAVDAVLAAGTGCDELDAARCLLPFPSYRFTLPDPSTPTGVRVELPAGQLPNASGTPLDVEPWRSLDGFSPGTPMLTALGDVDLTASGAPPIGDIARSITPDSATVVVDLTTGERLAHWAELDSRAPAGQQVLIIRAAAPLPEAHRIGVGVRNLVDPAGQPVEPTTAFRAYRDALTTTTPAIEDRRAEMEDLFAGLSLAGVDRTGLQQAWSFPVASAEALAGRMLHIRDDAFERLGDRAPQFTIESVSESLLPPGIGRRVQGTYQVPLYLTGDGSTGNSFALGPDGLPATSGATYPARFTCQIPAQALQPDDPATPVVYGHGLLGSLNEANGSWVGKISATNNAMYCATDWIGMSTADFPTAIAILRNISEFPKLADRVQQGILNTLFLARLLVRTDGFAADPAFQTASGQPVFRTGEVYYDGNSQGGIIGAAASAVAQDWTKAVLGVPGMNYSLLLNRSTDFDLYFTFLREAYPDPIDQQLIFGVLQMLWDRAEGNGYAQHTTSDPYPNTPAKQVILDVAFGDFQVPQVSAEIQARAYGAKLRPPALDPGRNPDTAPFFGLEEAGPFPTTDSVLVYWDSGTNPPPESNITPTESATYTEACASVPEDSRDDDVVCGDSHEDPRRAPESMRQKLLFFTPDGRIENTCGSGPCRAAKAFTYGF